MAFSFKTIGDLLKTKNFLTSIQRGRHLDVLHDFGQKGARLLSSATPVDTGRTATSWTYDVYIDSKRATISWSNSHLTNRGVPIVILLYYGHATGTGGYVQGKDFINPTIQPLFDELAREVWEAIKAL